MRERLVEWGVLSEVDQDDYLDEVQRELRAHAARLALGAALDGATTGAVSYHFRWFHVHCRIFRVPLPIISRLVTKR